MHSHLYLLRNADCEYSDGVVSFRSDALPFSYRVTAASAGAQDILRTVIVKDKKADVETRVYTMNGEDKDILDPVATVAVGSAGPTNAALLAVQILGTADAGLREKFRAHKEELRAKVAAANDRIHQA